MRLKVRKLTRLVLLATTIVLVYLTLFVLSSFKQLTQKYNLDVLFNLTVLYSNLTETNLLLDSAEDFLTSVHQISAAKFDDDHANELFFLWQDYTAPTQIRVPSHFLADQKPPVQPFDPRLTLLVYLNWIRRHPGQNVPFHWSDWVDLSDLNKFIFDQPKHSCRMFDIAANMSLVTDSEITSVDNYCVDDELFPLGFRISGFPNAQKQENARVLGKAYLYLHFESPTKLVFLTNDRGSYQVEVADHKESNLRFSLLQNNMVEEVISEFDGMDLDVLDAYRSLLKARDPSNMDQSLTELEIHLDEAMFDVNINETTEILRKTQLSLTRNEKKYLEALENSVSTTEPDKSFKEAKFLNADEDKVLGEHHDWRFFNGLTLFTDTQVFALHRLIKNYLQFCRVHGLVTWIAHGSLLSWYWNGMSFPWDDDTDVQMPLRDLHRLAREFNQTLVIENIGHDLAGTMLKDVKFNGMGTYFVDVGSSITHRERGNGMNNIDARFIDVSTGLYVDITGLALSAEKAPSTYDVLEVDVKKRNLAEANHLEFELNKQKQVFNCRNQHFSSLQELTPLVLLGVQNQLGYIPQNFGMLLDHEYQIKGVWDNNFQDYYYLNNLRIWVVTQTILDYITDKEKWTQTQKRTQKRCIIDEEKKSIADLDADDHINMLNHKWLLREYLASRNFTLFHEQQIKKFLRKNKGQYNMAMKKFADSANANTALWGDLFMTKIAVDGWEYEAEVGRIRELFQMKENEQEKAGERQNEKEKEEKKKRGRTQKRRYWRSGT